jgi:two-component system NtrC family response regulator
MNALFKPKLLIVEDDEGLQRQLRWAYDDYECWSPPTAPRRWT